MTREGPPSSSELRAVAGRTQSLGAIFRMMSTGFRARVTAALESAAALDEERASLQTHRADLQKSLEAYQRLLESLGERLEGTATKAVATLEDATTTQTGVLALQQRALAQESREKELHAEDCRLAELGESVARMQHEVTELLTTVQVDASQAHSVLEQATEQQARLLDRSNDLERQTERVNRLEVEVAEREGRVAVTESRQTDEAARLQALQSQLVEKDARLESMLASVGQAQGEIARTHDAALAQVAEAQRLQEEIGGHFATLEGKHAEFDERSRALGAREKDLLERHAEIERRSVATEERIAQLAGLEERNEQVIQFKKFVDEEKKRLDAVEEDLLAKHKRNLDAAQALADQTADARVLQTRIQETYEDIRKHRAEHERKADERSAQLDARTGELTQRQEKLRRWQLDQQVRERTIQGKFNELDVLAKRKEELLEQIDRTERERIDRIAEWEREQQRQRNLWAERRAEAEKARELYESNNELLRLRMDSVAGREAEHAARARELEERERELAKRERQIVALESQIRELQEQRISLNVTIAGLISRAGEGLEGELLDDAPMAAIAAAAAALRISGSDRISASDAGGSVGGSPLDHVAPESLRPPEDRKLEAAD